MKLCKRHWLRISGNAITSRMDAESVSSMTSLRAPQAALSVQKCGLVDTAAPVHAASAVNTRMQGTHLMETSLGSKLIAVHAHMHTHTCKRTRTHTGTTAVEGVGRLANARHAMVHGACTFD